jgi:hypothetical protein
MSGNDGNRIHRLVPRIDGMELEPVAGRLLKPTDQRDVNSR